MAMRPEVRRRGLVILVTAIVQWIFVRYFLLENPSLEFTKNERILIFSISSLGGAFAMFSSIIYIALFGNDHKDDIE